MAAPAANPLCLEATVTSNRGPRRTVDITVPHEPWETKDPSIHTHTSSEDDHTMEITDSIEPAAAVANGVRSSPSPSVPNGKPTSPYVKESNPMGANAAQTVSSKDPKAAAAAANDMRNVVRRKLTGYVGFANLPNQWHRKSVRKGFNFNVMVVGMLRERRKSLQRLIRIR
jgi:septin 7